MATCVSNIGCRTVRTAPARRALRDVARGLSLRESEWLNPFRPTLANWLVRMLGACLQSEGHAPDWVSLRAAVRAADGDGQLGDWGEWERIVICSTPSL